MAAENDQRDDASSAHVTEIVRQDASAGPEEPSQSQETEKSALKRKRDRFMYFSLPCPCPPKGPTLPSTQIQQLQRLDEDGGH